MTGQPIVLVENQSVEVSRGTVKLVLPYPVSSNRYWQSFAHPRTKHVITVVSKEAKDYKRHVGRLVRDSGIEEPIAGPVEVEIQLYPHRPLDWVKRAKKDPTWWDLTVQCIDLDNARKVLYDALKDVAFGDDKLVRRDTGVIMQPDDLGERVVVTVRPYVREIMQPTLFAEPVPARQPSAAERERVPF